MAAESVARETPLSESTPVRVGLVIVLLGAFSIAVTAIYRVGAAEKVLDQHADQIRTNEHELNEVKTQVAVSASGLTGVKEQLGKMDEKLDRLLNERAGTVQAKGRDR